MPWVAWRDLAALEAWISMDMASQVSLCKVMDLQAATAAWTVAECSSTTLGALTLVCRLHLPVLMAAAWPWVLAVAAVVVAAPNPGTNGAERVCGRL